MCLTKLQCLAFPEKNKPRREISDDALPEYVHLSWAQYRFNIGWWCIFCSISIHESQACIIWSDSFLKPSEKNDRKLGKKLRSTLSKMSFSFSHTASKRNDATNLIAFAKPSSAECWSSETWSSYWLLKAFRRDITQFVSWITSKDSARKFLGS